MSSVMVVNEQLESRAAHHSASGVEERACRRRYVPGADARRPAQPWARRRSTRLRGRHRPGAQRAVPVPDRRSRHLQPYDRPAPGPDRPPTGLDAQATTAKCLSCRHVREHVSERDLNPHGCDLRQCSPGRYWQTDNRRSEACICVRGASAPISQCILATEFTLAEVGDEQ